MGYIVYGPGAVGGTIAGRLFGAGHEVRVIARGPHAVALREHGLRLRNPLATEVHRIPVVEGPHELTWLDDDVVILAMKTQDTAIAARQLAACAPASLSVVCAQNGVDNERTVLRLFEHVYAMCVMLPASHLEPGVVTAYSSPTPGILDLGRFPDGVDDVCARIASHLEASGFSSRPDPAIMRLKYAKLLMNLGNALEAICPPDRRLTDLYRRARAEGEACLRAAGIDYASEDEDRQRRGDTLAVQPVDGEPRTGGSTWQSLARGLGATEVDYLNGEIALLGRLHGVATPVNAALQQFANRMARSRAAPASTPVEAFLEVLR